MAKVISPIPSPIIPIPSVVAAPPVNATMRPPAIAYINPKVAIAIDPLIGTGESS